MTVPSWLPDAFQPTCRPSSTATLAPNRAASRATVRPASPAPTTQMSTSRSNARRERNGAALSPGPSAALVEVSLMAFSYGPLRRLSPCPGHELVELMPDETNRDRYPCAD